MCEQSEMESRDLSSTKTYKKQKNNFGFKSIKNAEPVAEMKDFEDKLYDLVKDIKFEDVPNNFQT